MKSIAAFGLVATMAIAHIAAPAFAAEKSAEQLINAYTKAIGGEKALGKVKTIVRSGNVYLTIQSFELDGTIKESIIVGKKSYRAMEIADGGEKTVWDGEKGWKDSSEEGFSELSDEELEEVKLSSQISTLLALWRELGPKGFKVLPDEQLSKEDHNVLALADGEMTFYLNKKTHLLTAISMTDDSTNLHDSQNNFIESPELGNGEITLNFGKYADHGGIKMPNSISMEMGDGAFIMDFEYIDTKINAKIDEALFEKPKQ